MDNRRMCPHCRAFIKSSDRVCPYCENEVGPRAVERRSSGEGTIGGFIPQARFTTSIILLINLGLFIATVLASMRSGHGDIMGVDGRVLFDFGAKYRDAILLGQWWRLITAGFLHGGLLHILMNSWVLFDIGSQVEDIYGSARLIVIYFVATFFGFLASTFWSPVLSVGASAGIFGLIGAMIALGVRHKSPMGSAIRGFYMRWAIYGLVLGLLPGIAIDNAAHIGGLASGFVVAFIAGTQNVAAPWTERIWKLASYVCILITAYAFLEMFLWYSRGA